MRAKEFIFEDFKTAKTAFVNAGADPLEVDAAIASFRQLSQKNQLKPEEKNIDLWPKQGFEKFKQLVSRSTDATKTAIKRQKVPGKSINLAENEDWLLVIPLDKEASCFHGKGTDWCTTKPNQPYFEQYFYDKNVTLIYCLHKTTGSRWAIAAHTKTNKIECFTKDDTSITPAQFEEHTNLNPMDIRKLAFEKQHIEPVTIARKSYKDALSTVVRWIAAGNTTPNAEIEKLLLFTKEGQTACKYIKQVHTKNEDIQLLAVKNTANCIEYIEDPSEEVQLIVVHKYGQAIQYIRNPTPNVQLAAIEESAMAFEYIKNPIEEVKRIAVTKYGLNIRFIKNPSEELQLLAVANDGEAIRYITEPSLEIQLAAVSQNGNAIRYITEPSEKVQLAAVTQNGEILDEINNPSYAIQLAAVQQAGHAIHSIRNPSEELQLAAINSNPFAIQLIRTPTAKVAQLADKLTSEKVQAKLKASLRKNN